MNRIVCADRWPRHFYATLLLFSTFWFSPLNAQSITSTELPTQATVIQWRDVVQTSAELSPADKSEALKLLDASLALVQQADTRARQLQRFQDLTSSVRTVIRNIQAEEPPTLTSTLPGNVASLEALTQAQNNREVDRTALHSQLLSERARARYLQQRESNIVRQISEANRAIDALPSDRFVTPVERIITVAQARKLLEQIEQLELLQRIEDFQAELATVPSRQLIVSARIEQLERQLALVDAQLGTLERRVSDKQKQHTQTLLAETQEFLRRVQREVPSLSDAAERNVALAHELVELTTDPLPNTNRLREQVQRISNVQDTAKRVIDTGAVSDRVASLLNDLRADLPPSVALAEQFRAHEQQRRNLEFRLILWQETNRSDRLDTGLPGSGLPDLPDLFVITNQYHETLLQRLIERAEAITGAIHRHEAVLLEARQKVESLNALLDRNSLWLRSSEPLSWSWVYKLGPGLLWLIDGDSWKMAGVVLWQQATSRSAMSILALVVFIGLILNRSNLIRQLDTLATRVGRVEKDTYWTTPSAILLSALLVLPFPLILQWMSLMLKGARDSPPFITGLAIALSVLIQSLTLLLLFRTMCRVNGVFSVHFGWNERARRGLRRHLTWFTAWQSVVVLIFSVTYVGGDAELRYGLATLTFLLGSLGIGVFGFVFFRPVKGILYRIFDITEPSLTAHLMCFTLVSLPLVIGVMPLVGYLDSAIALQSRVFDSGALILVASIVYGLFVRFFMVAQRRFALRRARDKLREIRAARLTGPGDAAAEVGSISSVNDVVDHERMGTQTRTLLRAISVLLLIAGLLFIWRSFLPALGIAQDIVVWESTSAGDGAASVVPVSLWNLILAIGLIFGAILAVRNIRGPLEVGLFERLKLGAGERHAVITIIGYVLIASGLIGGLSQLGVQWSQLQWIVAALGIGLGFGLQEIVANFVSGLILLFERPIRIGDTVTIGGTTGTVRNIRIRATTITDFDNKDVTLPNTTVTTENVVNWTLHDAVTRLRIHVSVGHFDDVEQVQTIILSVIETHPDVVKEPAPTAIFMGYGDSVLNFDILVYFDSPLKLLSLTHDLNLGVNQALRRAGIQIPYPHREVIVTGRGAELTSD